MPLTKRILEPVNISRIHVPTEGLHNDLECVSNHSLANVIRQLSSLSKMAEDMFAELTEEARKVFGRTVQLQGRIEIVQEKVTKLNATVEEVNLQDIHLKKPFRSSVTKEQQVISRKTVPQAILENLSKCDTPPALDKLNIFREDGRDSMKFYTDPTYFVELWVQEMDKQIQENKSELSKKRERRRKPRGHYEGRKPREARNRKDEWQAKSKGEEFAEFQEEQQKQQQQQQQQQQLLLLQQQQQQQQQQQNAVNAGRDMLFSGNHHQPDHQRYIKSQQQQQQRHHAPPRLANAAGVGHTNHASHPQPLQAPQPMQTHQQLQHQRHLLQQSMERHPAPIANGPCHPPYSQQNHVLNTGRDSNAALESRAAGGMNEAPYQTHSPVTLPSPKVGPKRSKPNHQLPQSSLPSMAGSQDKRSAAAPHAHMGNGLDYKDTLPPPPPPPPIEEEEEEEAPTAPQPGMGAALPVMNQVQSSTLPHFSRDYQSSTAPPMEQLPTPPPSPPPLSIDGTDGFLPLPPPPPSPPAEHSAGHDLVHSSPSPPLPQPFDDSMVTHPPTSPPMHQPSDVSMVAHPSPLSPPMHQPADVSMVTHPSPSPPRQDPADVSMVTHPAPSPPMQESADESMAAPPPPPSPPEQEPAEVSKVTQPADVSKVTDPPPSPSTQQSADETDAPPPAPPPPPPPPPPSSSVTARSDLLAEIIAVDKNKRLRKVEENTEEKKQTFAGGFDIQALMEKAQVMRRRVIEDSEEEVDEASSGEDDDLDWD